MISPALRPIASKCRYRPVEVANPDMLRINSQAVGFVGHFVEANKPIAAICQTLIEVG
jgi:putative intracellular protease/amidase